MNTDYIKINAFKQKLKETLTEKRYQHTLRTLQKAMELSMCLECDREAVFWAALLHDCAKYTVPTEKQKAQLGDFAGYDKIIHAPLGAIVAREEYGISDERILNAIKYHTTGRANMTNEDKIVFLADAIEDGREYPNVERIRKETEKSIDDGIIASLEGVLEFEKNEQSGIHYLTKEALDYLKEEKK